MRLLRHAALEEPAPCLYGGIQRASKELDSGLRRNDDLYANRWFMDRQ